MRCSIKATISLLLFFILTCSVKSQQPKRLPAKTGLLTLSFEHVVNGQPLVLDDSSYTNPFGEHYTVHKLKYYVSNLQFFGRDKHTAAINKYFLVNQSIDSSCNIRLQLPQGEYEGLQFMIGVDSATNTAGAQTGPLDPLNDMYWTWQSGYIMQKLEGNSPQSDVVNNKMEYHLGGYGGANSTQRLVKMPFVKEALSVKPGGKTVVNIGVDLDQFWQNPPKITIKETPVCSSAGELAKQLSYNFAAMFSLVSVSNN